MPDIKFVQDHNHDNRQFEEGEVVELPKMEAKALIELGHAVEATEADREAWQKKLSERQESTNAAEEADSNE